VFAPLAMIARNGGPGTYARARRDIAAVTAFSAVNLHFIPLVARWAWPTVIGTLLITWANIQYRRPEPARLEQPAA